MLISRDLMQHPSLPVRMGAYQLRVPTKAVSQSNCRTGSLIYRVGITVGINQMEPLKNCLPTPAKIVNQAPYCILGE